MSNPQPLTVQFDDKGKITNVYHGSVTITGGTLITSTGTLPLSGGQDSIVESVNIVHEIQPDGSVLRCCVTDSRGNTYCC